MYVSVSDEQDLYRGLRIKDSISVVPFWLYVVMLQQSVMEGFAVSVLCSGVYYVHAPI